MKSASRTSASPFCCAPVPRDGRFSQAPGGTRVWSSSGTWMKWSAVSAASRGEPGTDRYGPVRDARCVQTAEPEQLFSGSLFDETVRNAGCRHRLAYSPFGQKQSEGLPDAAARASDTMPPGTAIRSPAPELRIIFPRPITSVDGPIPPRSAHAERGWRTAADRPQPNAISISPHSSLHDGARKTGLGTPLTGLSRRRQQARPIAAVVAVILSQGRMSR